MRPRELDLKLAEEIILRVSNGEMLQDIADDEDMPLPGVFLRWCRENPGLQSEYDTARRIGTEVMVDCVVVASRLTDPASSGVQSRAAMWHAERTWPDKYGPRATIKNIEKDPDTNGGVDYRHEVRQKLESVFEKLAERDKIQSEKV